MITCPFHPNQKLLINRIEVEETLLICPDAFCDYSIQVNLSFEINLEEARALNFLLRIHAGLLRQNEKEYEQLLRLINGIGTFVDKHGEKK